MKTKQIVAAMRQYPSLLVAGVLLVASGVYGFMPKARPMLKQETPIAWRLTYTPASGKAKCYYTKDTPFRAASSPYIRITPYDFEWKAVPYTMIELPAELTVVEQTELETLKKQRIEQAENKGK